MPSAFEPMSLSELVARRNYLTIIDNEGRPIRVNLTSFAARVQLVLEGMTEQGLARPTDSFGCTIATNFRGRYNERWDNPSELAEATIYWGPEGVRYTANGLRKMRVRAREGIDTLDLVVTGYEFRDKVESKDAGGHVLWGDFPWGGAVLATTGALSAMVGVSCYSQREDHTVALLIANMLLIHLRYVLGLDERPAYYAC